MVAVADRRPVNEARMTGLDYPTLFDRVLKKLKDEYGDTYNDFASTSLGVMIADMLAYALGQLAWAVDRRTSDSFVVTARTRAALQRVLRNIGYKLRPAAAASDDLYVEFEAALGADGVLPAGFRWRGPNGLVFETTADVSLVAGQPKIGVLAGDGLSVAGGVSVKEGEKKRIRFSSSGKPNQRFTLPNVKDGSYVADQSVRLWVDGVEWEEKDFLTFEKTNQFEVDYAASPPVVRLGNGASGNVPAQNADIVVTYVVTHGEGGMVRSGTIVGSVDVLLIGGKEVKFKLVTNPAGASGGAPPEDIEHARKFGPMYFAARDSAVTGKDYYALAGSFTDAQYGRVAKAAAVAIRSARSDVTLALSFDTLNDLAADLRDDVVSLLTTIDANAATIAAAVAEITKQRLTAASERTGLVGANGAISGTVATLRSVAATVTGLVASMKGTIGASTNPADGTLRKLVTGLSSVDQGKALDALNQVDSALTAVDAQAQSASGVATAVGTNVEAITLAADKMKAALDVIAAQETALTAASAGMKTAATSYRALAGALVTDVGNEVAQLEAYLSEVFVSDCSANVVSVPILVKNKDGFYAAPSAGLIRRLQAYLDARKDVTHLVKVVSGAPSLVPAVIRVKFKVTEGAISSEVRAGIAAEIDGALKDRDFGERLDLDDLYERVRLRGKPLGLFRVTIAIDGPADYLVDGNLSPGASRIVTKGSVTIEEELT